MSNLKKFAVTQTSRLHLLDAAGNPMYADDNNTLPIAANLYGPASKQHAAATARQSNRWATRLARGKKIEQTAEDKAREDAEFLADITQSFENLEEGKPCTTDRETILAQYMDPEIGFVKDQVAKHVADWANFSKPSATN